MASTASISQKRQNTPLDSLLLRGNCFNVCYFIIINTSLHFFLARLFLKTQLEKLRHQYYKQFILIYHTKENSSSVRYFPPNLLPYYMMFLFDMGLAKNIREQIKIFIINININKLITTIFRNSL